MSAGYDQHMQVAFPATSQYTSIGRVAMAGLALRLNFDVAMVESLRLAVTSAVNALGGSGSVTVLAQWNDAEVLIDISNPEASGAASSDGQVVLAEPLGQHLSELVDQAQVSATKISLTLAR